MERAIAKLHTLLNKSIPKCIMELDAPDGAGGNSWLDVRAGKRRVTLEYRPRKGFGIFRRDSGYGEGPAEIYRTPERAAKRVAQLMAAGNRKGVRLDLKDLRELYGQSQIQLARKAGVKQPAISRFEKRGEVKLSTLAATIKALGGKLEIRAHFSDADVPIALSTTKS